MKDTLAVIIPFYNAERYIKRCLDSCRDCPEIDEIVVVNDGSQDKSREIVEAIKADCNRIKLVSHPDQANHGVAASRNLGIRNTSADWITFCDADDYYLPRRFELFAKAADKHHSIYFETIGGEDGTTTGLTSFSPRGASIASFRNALIAHREERISIIGIIVRKGALESIGLFDESLLIGEDTDLIWRLAGRFEFSELEHQTPQVIRGSNPGSLSSNLNRVNRERAKFYAKWITIATDEALSKSAKKRIRDSRNFYTYICQNHGKSTLKRWLNTIRYQVKRRLTY